MTITVTVKPGAKQEKVTKLDDLHYHVTVKERAKENEANFAVLDAVAEYFKVSVSRVKLLRGKTSRIKVLEIS
jgi:uncharacterized protein YggU (UPF0235/DUF167 family)